MGGVDFFRRDLRISIADQIPHKIKNVHYNNNYNYNVHYLFIIFKFLQLVS